ncbi:GxxExxY protein [Asticcacaulis sp. AND118]|uniref:GxxExxY protein n=1 Tax=Asticcacaulis sp. AND118 TaxID=2840468 RepID=UPI001CFFE85A|nr:GxxExxY protein [Asticcacaulis sp. AND118]UDF03711.1 GxxExxY protein [Asticcacaulis sp. AND118]
MENTGLLYEAETYAIRGAIFEISREMGVGFLESVYQECLIREFAQQDIPAVAHPELRLAYKGEPLTQVYRRDFICFDSIIVELKTCRTLLDEQRAQVLNYLKASGLRVGLLVNFGVHPKAQIERLAL